MFNPEQLSQVATLVNSAQMMLVIFPGDATVDQAAAALALYQGLSQLGKQVLLLSPQQLNSSYTNLIAPETIATQLGNKDLQVIFDYSPEQVDKVSYHIDEERNKFLLVVQPQKGHAPLAAEAVRFEYAGAEADLIFLVGVKDYEQLDQLYVGYEQLYKDTTTISINTFAATVGSVNLDSSGTAAISEAIMSLLEQLGVNILDDAATNLLSGIETATDGFKSLTTSATTFEAVAKLLRSGARRLRRSGEASKKQVDTTMFSQTLKSNQPQVKKMKKESHSLSRPGEPRPGDLNYQPNISTR